MGNADRAGGCTPKRIRVGELDELLSSLIEAERGRADDDTDPDEEEDEDALIDLGFPQDLAIDLWLAWRDHDVTYTEYIKQPKRWRALIHTMNRAYNKAYEAQREVDPGVTRKRSRKNDDDDLAMMMQEMDRDGKVARTFEEFINSST